MSARIIIEKDGERYAPVDLFEHWFADDMKSMGMSNDDGEIEFAIKPLPPVIHTDNSAKCDCKDCSFRGMELCEHRKLQAENAKMREALNQITELDLAIHATPFMLNGEYVISGEEMLKHVRRITDAVRKAQEIMKGETK